MRKIIEVLRLRFEAGFTHERIATATRISKGAVTEYLHRARAAGIRWPLPPELDDAQLEALLFPRAAPHVERHAAPDFAHIHQELKRKGVTLMLLWEEYAEAHAGQAYRYSQFCLLYHRFAASLKRSMRQVHRAGEKLFIDYSGQTMPIIDAATGEVHRAQIFVAVLGASSYTYAEATMTQQLPDWIGSHVRLFEFLGCVPALLVPDQAEERHSAGLPLRARMHLDLRRSRAPLRHGGAGRPTSQTPRQGRRRKQRAGRAALDPRAAA
jgi:transposase